MGGASVQEPPQSPTDAPTPAGATQTVAKPNRAKRYAVLEDGDVRVFWIATADDAPIPAGVLVPLEGSPGFQTAQDARTWLRGQSLPAGRKLAVMRFQGILELQTASQPVTRLVERSRVLKRPLPGQAELPFQDQNGKNASA